jgi:hypothetical protein
MVVKRVEIKKEREVNTYAELWDTSHCLLKKGQEDERGCTHQFRASIVFTAFTMEAYLNHIGPKIFNCWKDLEFLSPVKKLNVIAEKLKVPVNYGKRPWQIMKDLFPLRHKIAHGKSSKINEEKCIPVEDYDEEEMYAFIQTDWEKKSTADYASRAIDDVKNIITILQNAAGFTDTFVMGMQVRSSSFKD